MKEKIVLGLGVILLGVVVIASFLVFRSHMVVTSRYTELDRAGCINRTELKVYGEHYFHSDNRRLQGGSHSLLWTSRRRWS
jgi:hypothetical protein